MIPDPSNVTIGGDHSSSALSTTYYSSSIGYIPQSWLDGPLWSVSQYMMFEHKQCLKNQSTSKHAGFTGWWFGPLWKILVIWDDSDQYMEK